MEKNEEKKVQNILDFHKSYSKPELCICQGKERYKLLNHVCASNLIDDGLKEYLKSNIRKVNKLYFLPDKVIIEKMNALAQKVYEIELKAYNDYEKQYNLFAELERIASIDYEKICLEIKAELDRIEKEMNEEEEKNMSLFEKTLKSSKGVTHIKLDTGIW